MYPIYHFIFTVVLSGFLYPVLGWKLALFWLGSYFVDVDHYWWYILKFKDLSLRKAYDYSKKYKMIPGKLHIFHTVEFWVLMLVWGLFSEFGFAILLGLLFHMVVDMCDMVAKNELYARSFTFFGWVYSPSNSIKV